MIQEIEKDEGDIPLIFFSDKQPSCWIETIEETWLPWTEPLQDQASIQAKYFSVSDRVLPDGFVFIMLPSFRKSSYVDLSESRLFRSKDWRTEGSHLLWMDSFPFVQASSLKIFEDLSRQMRPIRKTIGILQSSRRYAYSDLEMKVSLEERSAAEWKRQVVCDEQIIIGSEEFDHRFFASFLYLRPDRLLKIEEEVYEEINQKRRFFEKYVREDYSIVLGEMQPDTIALIFEYESWRQTAPTDLVEYWNQRTSRLIVHELNEKIMEFIAFKIDGTEIYSLKSYFQPYIDEVWKAGFLLISSRLGKINLSPSLSQFDFMPAIKSLKIRYIEQLNEIIKVSMYNVIQDSIQNHYDLWKRGTKKDAYEC
ncbi:hypothetical protein [Saccharibacillus brassicae]|nr:hypothetical protein [Saccharibacillus brassicae]